MTFLVLLRIMAKKGALYSLLFISRRTSSTSTDIKCSNAGPRRAGTPVHSIGCTGDSYGPAHNKSFLLARYKELFYKLRLCSSMDTLKLQYHNLINSKLQYVNFVLGCLDLKHIYVN